jgi:hypothetical protein
MRTANSEPRSAALKRLGMIAWTVAAIGGTIAVWWLSSYIDGLTTLAETDRSAALELFRTRALPALLAVVAVAVASGAVLLRQGLQIARTRERGGRTVGNVVAAAGFMLAAVPLALISIVLYLLRRG